MIQSDFYQLRAGAVAMITYFAPEIYLCESLVGD